MTLPSIQPKAKETQVNLPNMRSYIIEKALAANFDNPIKGLQGILSNNAQRTDVQALFMDLAMSGTAPTVEGLVNGMKESNVVDLHKALQRTSAAAERAKTLARIKDGTKEAIEKNKGMLAAIASAFKGSDYTKVTVEFVLNDNGLIDVEAKYVGKPKKEEK